MKSEEWKPKYIFGTTKTALVLEKEVSVDPRLQAKVINHVANYNHYVNEVLTMKCHKAIVKALSVGLECELVDVPEKIQTYMRNLKATKRKKALASLSAN